MSTDLAFIDYVNAAEAFLEEGYGLTIFDAGVELEQLDEAQQDGWSPKDFVEWFATKYDLDPVNPWRPGSPVTQSRNSDEPDTSRHAASPRHAAIRVLIRGGLVQGAETLTGQPVLIDVIDYDTDGADPSELETDPHGAPCWRYTT